MSARLSIAVVGAACSAACATFGISTASGGAGVTPAAVGNQVIASGPHVYNQTTAEYAGSWSWSQRSATYDYYWYMFRSDGALQQSGHNPTGGGGSWSGAPAIYYFKEYNNEPLGSGHNNIISVDYCC
jgi:hypothetical protein